MQVQIRNLTKEFGKTVAVNEVTTTFPEGKMTVLVGPSGCGKSTLMRMITGLENPTSGDIYFDGKYVNDRPAWDRNVAMVFQSFALYPHMSAFDNIAFPLKTAKMKRSIIKQRVHEAAELLGIGQLLERKPRELSGGQQQRVALGRAIVRQPDVFLMDEPLSNLDETLRHEMRRELRRLQRELDATMIYVTHDQTEAMTMGDNLMVMWNGSIQQVGTPQEIYHTPRTAFVGSFIGSPAMNFLDAIYDNGDLVLPKGRVKISEGLRGHLGGVRDVIVGIRPEDFKFVPSGEGKLQGTIYTVEPLGRVTLVTVEVADLLVRAFVSSYERPELNSTVGLAFEEKALHLFSGQTQERLV